MGGDKQAAVPARIPAQDKAEHGPLARFVREAQDAGKRQLTPVLPERGEASQANKDLQNLIAEGKKNLAPNGQPRIKEVPVSKEDKAFGVRTSIEVNSPNSRIRHSFDVDGKPVGFDSG